MRCSRLLLLLTFAVSACGGDDDDLTDTGTFQPLDSGRADTGVIDTGVADTGAAPTDSGTPMDAGADSGTDGGDAAMEDDAGADAGMDGGSDAEVDAGEDAGADMGTPGMGDGGMGDAGMGDAGSGDAGSGGDAGVSPSADVQIQAVRMAAEGAMSATANLPVDGALVTYVVPAGEPDQGFFIQGAPRGAAVFVRTATVVSAGDVVNLTVSEVNDNNDLLEATGLSRLAVVGSAPVAGFLEDISAAADVVSMLRSYESRYVRITGTLGTDRFAGAGYRSYDLETAGLTGSDQLRLRLPLAVHGALEATAGCEVTATGAMWRFRGTAQPHIWAIADLSAVSCPVAAAASGETAVVVRFGRSLDPASVLPSGSQFTIPGLAVTAASVSGASVTLTTAAQTAGTSYTVTVAGSVRDVTGSPVAAPNNQAPFTGFAPPAAVLINEVYYDAPGADGPLVFTELVGPAGTDLTGWELVGYARSNGMIYRRVTLGGSIPARSLYVVATAQATGDALANRDWTGDIDWQNNESAVQLLDPAGNVVDAVQWGTHPNLMFGRGNPAPQTASNQPESISRDALHTNTDDNATDFSVITPPTPGAP